MSSTASITTMPIPWGGLPLPCCPFSIVLSFHVFLCALADAPADTLGRCSTDRRSYGADPRRAVGGDAPCSLSFRLVSPRWGCGHHTRSVSPRSASGRSASVQRQREALGERTERLWQQAQYSTRLKTSHAPSPW